MQVEDAKAGFFHTSKGRRAALAVAAGIWALADCCGSVIIANAVKHCSLQCLSVLTMLVSAERGNCQLLASVYEAAEQAKGSWQTRQDFLNAPGSKGQTLLMTSCCNGYEPAHLTRPHLACTASTPILSVT